jgi:hypothetical protein
MNFKHAAFKFLRLYKCAVEKRQMTFFKLRFCSRLAAMELVRSSIWYR